MKEVSFSRIKKGGFFRMRGKVLYQKIDNEYGQQVTGRDIGTMPYLNLDVFVIPVNAKIVMEDQ